jgi:hypothetical protein
VVNSVFKVSPSDDQKLQEYKDRAIKDLNEFFNQRWVHNTPKIFVVDDRKTIDLLHEKETEDWVVGWSWGRQAIFILNPENISTESCHKEKYDVAKLIKHELCHSFFQKTFGMSEFAWINEGVALYVADQLDSKPKPKTFEGFLDGNKIYQESGYVIKLIMDNYGKNKLFEFLEKQRGVKDKEALELVYQEVFGLKLEYSFFNNFLSK